MLVLDVKHGASIVIPMIKSAVNLVHTRVRGVCKANEAQNQTTELPV
jgi:hypothetical protein